MSSGTGSRSGEPLVGFLFDGLPHASARAELRDRLASSSRFRAFAELHRDKIRKKLRGAKDEEALHDVRIELRVAGLLLEDRRIGLEFERYGSGKPGPDFTVAVAGEAPFNLEVTRLRRPPTVDACAGTILAKLRQLPPGIANALLIAVPEAPLEAADVGAACLTIRAKADRKDEAFLARSGFEGPRDFYARYLRLGEVVVWSEDGGHEQARTAAWTNRSARTAVPARAIRVCVAALEAAAVS